MKRRHFLEGLLVAPVFGALADQTSVRYQIAGDGIQVFRAWRGAERVVQSVASERPVFLALHPGGKFLLAVNGIDRFEGLPTGSVEAFAVRPGSGELELINRRALALSATLPRHCAVSPDGRHLVVAAFGGGSYNVLSIDAGGRLGPVSQVIKEIGRGDDPVQQATAHPHSVAFHPGGQFMVGTDFGSDRINVFRFDRKELVKIQRIATEPGSGPGDLEFDASAEVLTVRHELKKFAIRYRFDGAGRIAQGKKV